MTSAVDKCKYIIDTIHVVSSDTIHHVVNKTTHNVFVDSVYRHFFDTTHTILDTTLSLGAFKNAQDAYNTMYASMQNDMSNIIMIFAFIIAVLTLIFGGNFIWQNGVGLRLYKKSKKDMEEITTNAVVSFKITTISAYIDIGNQFYACSNGNGSKESLYYFYVALNFLVREKFEKNNEELYIVVLEGIYKNSDLIDSVMSKIILSSLEELKKNIDKNEENIYKLIEKIIGILECDIEIVEARDSATEEDPDVEDTSISDINDETEDYPESSVTNDEKDAPAKEASDIEVPKDSPALSKCDELTHTPPSETSKTAEDDDVENSHNDSSTPIVGEGAQSKEHSETDDK